MARRTKYNSNKIIIDGTKFDSKDEAKYYEYLKQMKFEGKILNFELQPKFILIPKFQYSFRIPSEELKLLAEYYWLVTCKCFRIPSEELKLEKKN